jgi:hypothetical protein
VATRIKHNIDVTVVTNLAKILVSALSIMPLLLKCIRSLRSRIAHALLQRGKLSFPHAVLAGRHISSSGLRMHSSPRCCDAFGILLRRENHSGFAFHERLPDEL